ncbi:deoxyuridylate hydroxymethyltransferase [Agathobaculum phage AB434P2]|nr:deoxyuridylate hydroxymethyltransferase [Agathobaculum phage AB434P2]WAX05188.1 deoxyuridylate hydroxymethyltransferase [Agathobaculum phage AB434P3]
MEYNVGVADKSIDLVWTRWYDKISKMNEPNDSRDGMVIGEVINAISVIEDPTKNVLLSPIRKLSMRYAVGEFLWYLSGSNKLKEISKYTKNWERFSDDGENLNSCYGWCIKHKFGFDQYEYVKELLKKDRNTRQAVIHIKEPNNKPSKDVNCTICLQFFIRENKLYLTTYMRSCDLWYGFPYDVFNFCNLQVLLSMELGVELGTYTHICGSLHLYERDKK